MRSQPVELRDQLSIETPELVSINLSLAGIGSRCLAVLIDYLIQGVAVSIGVLLLALLFSGNAGSRSTTRVSVSHAYKWGLVSSTSPALSACSSTAISSVWAIWRLGR
jgi:hypothetical protein